MTLIKVLFFINIVLILFTIFIEEKHLKENIFWILILLLLPIVGFMLFMVFGSSIGFKVKYFIRNKKLIMEYKKYINIELSFINNTSDNMIVSKYNNLIEYNLKNNKSLISKNNNLEVFTTGINAYNQLFNDILNAKKNIFIEYYAIHNDRIGRKFRDILTLKAREGVQVNLLYDGLVNYNTPKSFFNELVEYGGKIINYKRFFIGANFRNHRKIVVIDDQIGYLGGMNIGCKYCNMNKHKSPWRDTQIRIIGDSVLDLKYNLICDWNLFAFKYDCINDINFLENYNTRYTYNKNLSNASYIQIVAGGCNSFSCNTELSYLEILGSASKRIFIQTPYIIPGNLIIKKLISLSESGVKISIMCPSIKPNTVLEYLSNYYIDKLIKYGIKIYKYKGYIHAKTILIDDDLTCIGSVNLDERSLKVNDEIFACIYDCKFNKRYLNILLSDIKNSFELDYKKFNNRSIITRFLEFIISFFSPLF